MSTSTAETVDLSLYIEWRDKQPHIRGRRLPVAFIATAYQQGKVSIGELAHQFTLSEEQVLAALLYYREHQAEVDALDEAARQESLSLQARYGRHS